MDLGSPCQCAMPDEGQSRSVELSGPWWSSVYFLEGAILLSGAEWTLVVQCVMPGRGNLTRWSEVGLSGPVCMPRRGNLAQWSRRDLGGP